MTNPVATEDAPEDPAEDTEDAAARARQWQWDPSLYRGSAAHYAVGREPYPPALADTIADHLGLDGTGDLADLGCGPGSLTVPMSRHVARAVGVDADADMVAEARRRADRGGHAVVRWVNARAEDLPLPTGRFRVVTLAQSFHWMDRERVATQLRRVLEPGGAAVFVHATTHRGTPTDDVLPHPQPPWDDVEALVRTHLGERRRAGRGVRAFDEGDAEELGALEKRIFRAAGFTGPTRLEVPGHDITRDLDRVVASVFSLSYAAPHLFGDRVAVFEAQLRALLRDASPTGTFSERMRAVDVDVWRA